MRAVLLYGSGVVFVAGGAAPALCVVLAAGMASRKVHFWDDIFWPFAASAFVAGTGLLLISDA